MRNTLDLCDANAISKVFERGCHFSLTQESVFAVMTPYLGTLQSMSKNTQMILNNNPTSGVASSSVTSNASSLSGSQVGVQPDSLSLSSLGTSGALVSRTTADGANVVGSPAVGSNSTTLTPGGTPQTPAQVNQSIADRLANQFTNTGTNDSLGGILNSKCIPCSLRINLKEQLNWKSLLENPLITILGTDLYKAFIKFYNDALSSLNTIIGMLKGTNNYVDICAFLKFLQDFVCVPDLERILAGLAALLIQLGLELSSMFDLVIQLIGPLLMPFLTALLDQVTKFLLAAIMPLQCIVNSIQVMLSKLNYSVLFQNMSTIEKGFQQAGSNIANMASKTAGAVSSAYDKLTGAQTTAQTVDQNNPTAVQVAQVNLVQAQKGYSQANQNQDLTAIDKAQAAMTSMMTGVKGALSSLINYLQRLVDNVNKFWNSLISEIMKLLQKFMGSGTGMLFSLQDKLAILQIVGMVTAIIKAIQNGLHCSDTSGIDTAISQIPSTPGLTIMKNNDGTFTFSNPGSPISNALSNISLNSPNSDGNTSQNSGSLIKSTGNPVLDSNISKTVTALTTPVKVTFKCSMQTTVANAEQVNTWITELNSIK